MENEKNISVKHSERKDDKQIQKKKMKQYKTKFY